MILVEYFIVISIAAGLKNVFQKKGSGRSPEPARKPTPTNIGKPETSRSTESKTETTGKVPAKTNDNEGMVQSWELLKLNLNVGNGNVAYFYPLRISLWIMLRLFAVSFPSCHNLY